MTGNGAGRTPQWLTCQAAPRTHAEVSRFFTELELIPPGLVPIPDWRPEAEAASTASIAMWGGVGRKG